MSSTEKCYKYTNNMAYGNNTDNLYRDFIINLDEKGNVTSTYIYDKTTEKRECIPIERKIYTFPAIYENEKKRRKEEDKLISKIEDAVQLFLGGKRTSIKRKRATRKYKNRRHKHTRRRRH
jgi:hypothetical protein